MLAGIGAGLFSGLDGVARMSSVGARFEPQMSATDRAAHLTRWERALDRTRSTPSRAR
jgi:glycerol kinase